MEAQCARHSRELTSQLRFHQLEHPSPIARELDRAEIMTHPKISETVARLLQKEGSPFTDRYHEGLELQIQPFDEADRQERDWYQSAWPIRIPKNAKGTPEDNDVPMPYHPWAIQRIGWTGWNWRDLKSEFVIFDIDSLFNHKAGLSDKELEAAKQAACNLPYLTVRRSKSGLGLHCYCDFENPPNAANHTEHARLAQQVLQKMSADSNFDFASSVDVAGGNAWFFNREILGTRP